MKSSTSRRRLITASAAATALAHLPMRAAAQQQRFAPEVGEWRTFELTTRVDLLKTEGAARVWLPVPSVDTDFQMSQESSFSSTGRAVMVADGREGARMLCAEFPADTAARSVELVSRVRTRNRAVDWSRRVAVHEEPSTLAYWRRPTTMIPTDGIVLKTALQATQGARTDVEKVRKVYDWIVANTYREPKVRGCGEGNIKVMLETGNLGGKCADLNALFVGLVRAVGIPARDVYGIRLAPSRFGYRELGGNSASLQGAQHCRAEVFLKDYGWVAMDPADVAKVMRQETPQWLKDVSNPVVAPVHKALFGAWEGNWLGYNNAHDVKLPGSQGETLPFLMYPIGEDANGRMDSYAPDDFRYRITAREI